MRYLCCNFTLSLSLVAAAGAQALPDTIFTARDSNPATKHGLPPAPTGRSTAVGGEIQKVDLVRDQISLKVPAGHVIKILFDERTEVFHNGKKMSILDLHPEDHASIETTLDGTRIFALRIHTASDLPDGRLHGTVERYDAATGELRLALSHIRESVSLMAGKDTPIARVGDKEFVAHNSGAADLIAGSLVDVSFKSTKGHPGAATRVDILAVPGSEFVFEGTLSFLDLRSGRLSIQGASDRDMDISFEPSRFPVSEDLHQGSSVKVSARFDGSRYLATSIDLR